MMGFRRQIDWRLFLCGVLIISGPPALAHDDFVSGFSDFVRRDGDTLREEGKTYRFVSFNIPNLHFVEDDLAWDQSMPFRVPTDFEIDDALASIAQLGGQAVRTYVLSVRKTDDPPGHSRHILGPGEFEERSFVALDRVMAAAHRHKIRIIFPFIDQWSWWGGTTELAGFRGKKQADFWTDPQLFDDYKAIVAHLVNRKNTVTGLLYREDPAILAWETGNELGAPDAWTAKAAAYIKSLDSNHLVLDGTQRPILSPESLADPNIDFLQTHHYERDVREMIDRIRKNRQLSKGKKPYHVGEFGFLGTEALRAVIDTAIDEGTTGAMLWSLRSHHDGGGFFWHHEPAGGDQFKAYHWPGFPDSGEVYDERRLLRILRQKAHAIRGLDEPPVPAPAVSASILNVDDGGQLNWRGSPGASGYDIERAESASGPWTLIAADVSDARVQYHPLFSDESIDPGKEYAYRVIARNASGAAEPSQPVGPVKMSQRTLVDEFWNDSRLFRIEGKPAFAQNEARKFREDCHRIAGKAGDSLVYLARDGISSVRLFTFGPGDQPNLKVSLSSDDGVTYQPVQLTCDLKDAHGKANYGFWNAYECRVQADLNHDTTQLKIEFTGVAQIGRVEVGHGRLAE